jgi:hypothetical protein
VDATYWDDLVAAAVRGKLWIAAFDILGGLSRFTERLARQGADGLFVIAGNRGTGELPPAGFAAWHILGIEATDIMDGIRRFESSLVNLPPDVVAAVDAFDPNRSARVLRTVFAIDHDVAGRRSYGARPAEWVDRLEDKTRIDELWDAAGVERAASLVVDAHPEALRAAAALDGGMGTVWAADSSRGWHGGASHVRWLREGYDPAVADFFAERSDRVRVMPFLEGIPCSIHGMVVAGEVIVFRPVELLIMRRPGSSRFFYGGAATSWDPPERDATAMRWAARRVGHHLMEHVGYRGAFNLDGVLTADGWRPTELNARFSAGLATLQAGFAAPLYHLHLMMVEGEAVDFRPLQLEGALLEATEEARGKGFGAPLEGVAVNGQHQADVIIDDDGCRQAVAGEEPTGSVTLGPSTSGGYLRYEARRPTTGSPFAPVAATVLAFADEQWGTGIGSLQPAPSVR